jgi:hypothetical protein
MHSSKRRLPRHALAAAACFGVLGFVGSAQAVPVAFAFEAIQDKGPSWIIDSPDGAVGVLFSVGDTISGQFVFESTATDGGSGYFSGALSSASFTVNGGSYGGSSTGGDIQFSDNWFVTHVTPGTGLVAPDVGANWLAFFFVQVSSTAIAYGDGSLPTTPPPISPGDDWGSNWDRVELLFRNSGGTISGIDFTLTSLRAVPVPEPGTFALVGLGLAMLAGHRKRS